jgi:GR25 family glycosyltransferase involved in LPS biosynthesis
MHIFIISITGSNRISANTFRLIQSVEKHGGQVHWVGEKKSDKKLLLNNDFEIAEFITGGSISSGEMGCLLNHQYVYKRIVDLNLPNAIVLEDDADLIVSYNELDKIVDECINSRFDLINFNSSTGGVLIGKDNNTIFRSLVPCLSAFSYWVSISGAKELLATQRYLGLADWPISIFRIKSAATIKNVFEHGDGLSLIGPTLNKNAHKRINLVYRPILQIFSYKNSKIIYKLIDEIGLVLFLKIVFYIRIIKRISKIFKGNQNNSTITFSI